MENDVEKYDQDWIIAMTKTQDLIDTKIGFCKTDFPVSCGESKAVCVVMLILQPEEAGSINSSIEIARTFGTMFRNEKLISELKLCNDDVMIRQVIQRSANDKLIYDKLNHNETADTHHHEHAHDEYGPYHRPSTNFPLFYPFYGIYKVIFKLVLIGGNKLFFRQFFVIFRRFSSFYIIFLHIQKFSMTFVQNHLVCRPKTAFTSLRF